MIGYMRHHSNILAQLYRYFHAHILRIFTVTKQYRY